MKIVFTIASGLGDALFFAPSLLALKDIYPEAEIDALVPKISFNKVILKDILGIREIICLNRVKTIKPLELIKYSTSFRDLMFKIRKNRYDIFINTVQARIIDQYLLQISSKARTKICPVNWRDKKNPFRFLLKDNVESNSAHIVQEHFDIIKYLSKNKQILLKEYLNKLNRVIRYCAFPSSIKLYSDNIITIFPGSGSQSYKRWPFERYIKVIEYLYSTTKYDIGILGGNDEYDSSKIPRAISKSPRFHNIGASLNINQIINLLSFSKFIIANDNGLLHLAEAMKIPTIGIYPTNWGYVSGKYLYSDVKHIVLPKREKDCIVQHLKTKSFRSKSFEKQCQNIVQSVTVKTVLEKVNTLLNYETIN